MFRIEKQGSVLLNFLTRLIGLFCFFFSFAAHAQVGNEQRLIVKWKTDSQQGRIQALARTESNFNHSTGMRIHHRRNLNTHLDVLQLDRHVSDTDLSKAIDQLNRQADVEYAVEDQRKHIQSIVPNDPFVTATAGRTGQWFLFNEQPAAINAYSAWDMSLGGSLANPVTVAVIDTGVVYNHPDLASKLLPGYDFVSCDQSTCSGTGLTYYAANDGDGWDADASDPGDWISTIDIQNHPDLFGSGRCDVSDSSWHGTQVSGIIAASTNNGVGVAGIGWNARILPVRVLGKCGGWDSDIIAGMRWAGGLTVTGAPSNPNPAKVLNLSLGAASSCNAAYADVISQLTSVGVSIVAAAGNDSAIINTPANCSGVNAIVGVRHVGTKVGFSSLGTGATLAAPAGNCVNSSGACLFPLDTTTNLGTTSPGLNSYSDQYNSSLGTSFSTPMVAGTIALMLGVNPALQPAQITSILRSSAKPFPQTASQNCVLPTSHQPLVVNESDCNCSTTTCGAGLLDAYQALLNSTQLSVGGSVTGLASGKTLVLKNNTTTLVVSSNSGFRFPAQSVGTAWNVSIGIQPSGQICTVNNGIGSNITVNVSNVNISCQNVYTVSGSVSGLGSTLVLRLGKSTLVVGNGAKNFKFAMGLTNGTTYNVLTAIQPTGYQCIVTNGAGTISAASVTNVMVSCAKT